MTALDFEDGSSAGALARYPTVHTPLDELPSLFREFPRVLAPGGLLAPAYRVGDACVHLTHAYGHPLDLDGAGHHGGHAPGVRAGAQAG
jgi:hypothetical protein